ncbi:hypothetical protein HK101_009668 [Irineochytrium annulatum]|nr:hypothetical protein HK101_009668 [Irineochytrium annulatum]
MSAGDVVKREDDDVKPRMFDYAPLLPSFLLGQSRNRLKTLVQSDTSLALGLLVSMLAGAAQASFALYLHAPSALEKRPEERALVKRVRAGDFWGAWRETVVRNAIGFGVFFLVFDFVKSKRPNHRDPARVAQNLLATILATVGYRGATWAVDGKLPTDVEEEGKRGGNPYAGAVKRIQTSAVKALVTMTVMDFVLGKPSW